MVAAIVPRGRPCPRCGADRWRTRPSSQRQYCAECDRRRSANRRGNHGGAQGLYDQAQKRATQKGLVFTIVVDDVIAVMPLDGRCPALGLVLEKGRGEKHDRTPTLDRLNPMKGYEPGNIAVISDRANRMKSDGTATELELVAAWMRSRGLD